MRPLPSSAGRSAVHDRMLRCVPKVSAKKLSSVDGLGMRDDICVLVHSRELRRAQHQGIAERRSSVSALGMPFSSITNYEDV